MNRWWQRPPKANGGFRPDVGDDVWYSCALSMHRGRIEAIKDHIYLVRREGGRPDLRGLDIIHASDIWPPDLMTEVGAYPPGYRTAPLGPPSAG